MKKKTVIFAIYFLYVALLFLLTASYEIEIDQPGADRFSDFFSLLSKLAAISFLSSIVVLILANTILRKFSFSFSMLIPVLFFVVALFVGFGLSFVIWIAGLKDILSIYQIIFLSATFATLGLLFWIFNLSAVNYSTQQEDL
jgi:hypothetical protein